MGILNIRDQTFQFQMSQRNIIKRLIDSYQLLATNGLLPVIAFNACAMTAVISRCHKNGIPQQSIIPEQNEETKVNIISQAYHLHGKTLYYTVLSNINTFIIAEATHVQQTKHNHLNLIISKQDIVMSYENEINFEYKIDAGSITHLRTIDFGTDWKLPVFFELKDGRGIYYLNPSFQ